MSLRSHRLWACRDSGKDPFYLPVWYTLSSYLASNLISPRWSFTQCGLTSDDYPADQGHILKEQFTREWDNVNYEPFSEGIPDPNNNNVIAPFSTTPTNQSAGAAGAYSEKSNMYAAALVRFFYRHVAELKSSQSPSFQGSVHKDLTSCSDIKAVRCCMTLVSRLSELKLPIPLTCMVS